MGTRGYYAFKYNGRTYVFYNHWDSYPEGLGSKLVSMIPSEPAKYRQWLEMKRAEYSDAETRLRNTILNVSAKRAFSGETLPVAAIGLENLNGFPSFGGRPKRDLFIEWVYVIDLDCEELYVSDHAHFSLTEIRTCGSWYNMLEEAAKLHKDAREQAVLAWPLAHPLEIQPSHRVMTTGIRAQMETPDTTMLDYQALGATVVQPKQSGTLLNRPIVAIARQVFDLFRSGFKTILWDAQYVAQPNDLIFREAAFIAISICSASPHLLRMGARLERNELTVKSPFAVFRPSAASGERPEFASSLFQGYHLAGYNSGSSGQHCTYWLSDVLICLASDLSSEASIKATVVQAVKSGRSEGRERFNAIVTSISHAVVVRVTESEVQHTKRFPFLSGRQSSHDVALAADMSSWVDQDINAISALAHVFEATALETHGLVTSGPRGIFPNEVYREIIQHIDSVTRMSCLSISRAFRDFASEIFPLDDNLFVVSATGSPELRCVSATTAHLGELRLSASSEDKDIAQWHPVIGHDDNTASFMSRYSLSVPSYELAPLAVQPELAEDESTADVPSLSSSDVDEEYDRVYMCVRMEQRGRNSAVQMEHGFAIFEKHLPSQSVIASAGDIMCLYSAAFFLPLEIFGSGPSTLFHHWRSRTQDSIDVVPTNVCMYVGARGTYPELAYGLAWAKQPFEDTPKGWQKALSEAKGAATTAYVQYLYKAWTQGRDISDDDFAVAVLIGGRCCFFHQGGLPSDYGISPLASLPELAVTVSNPLRRRTRESDSSLEFWTEAGINAGDVVDSVRQGWVPIHEGGQDDGVRSLSVHEAGDRAKICEAFAWVQGLAQKRGDDDTMRFG